jgi:hypothetical protein
MGGFVSKIIMPAGDVFMFKGINTDATGNLCSSVTYASLTGGAKF